MSKSSASETPSSSDPTETARARLSATGRNDLCPCGSNKKYKKCHLADDEKVASPPPAPVQPQDLVAQGWKLFEMRRPGAAEKAFRGALQMQPGMMEAQVGIGMARLSAGDGEGARKELQIVVDTGAAAADIARAENVKDGFNRRELQPYMRAAHALGCLAYDESRLDDAVTALTGVYQLEDGSVGLEARLVTGTALVRLGRPVEAIPVLEPVTKTAAAGRALMGLVLAHATNNDIEKAHQSLAAALASNPHFGKAVLGRIRRKVDAMSATTPGSLEEALVYAQTYGDAWDDKARLFLTAALDGELPAAAAAE